MARFAIRARVERIRTLCAGVAPGGGRIMQCIANRGGDLSAPCRDVLVPFMVR